MAPTPPIPHQDDAEAQPPGGRPEQEYPRAERYRAVNRPLNFRQSAIQIEREVGRGGNAVVHRVTIVGRHPGLAVNEAALKTFVSGSVDEVCHEVDVHLQLADHLVAAKYIPAIYGVAVDDSDRPLGIVMELVQGQTLEAYFADRQPSRSPLDMLREVLRIGIEATEGIIAINGVATHKDLSPRNILVRTTQHGVQVVIVDFGSAHIHDTADLGPRPRTVRYAASEIKDNQPGSRTSDVYSLAAVLKDLFVLPMAALAEAPEYKTAVQLLRTQFADFLAEDQKQRRDGLELLEVLRSAEANLRPRRIRSRRVRVGVMLGANAAVLGCIFFLRREPHRRTCRGAAWRETSACGGCAHGRGSGPHADRGGATTAAT
jgi:serine/threonine protein kinase